MAQSRARRRAPLECGRAATVARAGGGGSAAPGVRRRRRAPRPHGRVRLRGGAPERQPAAHHPPARQPGAALRPAHDARALRLDPRSGAVSRPGVVVVARSPHPDVPVAARRALARRRSHHRPRRRVDLRGGPRLADLADVAGVDDPDDSTAVVRFTRPPRGLPGVFADLAVLPAHLLDSVPRAALRRAAWNAAPVGNGPFRCVAHEPGRRWVFAANPDFPAELGGPPSLERLVIAVVDDPLTKLAALARGEVDFAGIQPAHATFVRRDSALALVEFPVIFPYGIVFNLRRPPFAERRLRLAVALALDRRALVAGYLFGFGTVADGPVPPGVPGALALPPIPADPDSARRLLAGRRVAFELLTVGSGEAALEQMIQAQLARVGFDVAIRQLELAAFLDRVNARHPDFAAAVVGTPGDPGLGYVAALAALAGLDVPADPARAQRLFRDSLPVAFLYHARGLVGMNRRVRGVRMDLRGELATVARWRVRR